MKPFFLVATLAISAAAQTYTVAGIVVDVVSSKPMERARVSLVGAPAGTMILTTSLDGRFTFDVPRGKYQLVVQHNGWGMQFGNPGPTAGFGSAIVTGPDQDTAHLTFRWFRPGDIFGTVVDEQGDGVRDATVQLFRDGVIAGRRRIVAAATTQTDDRGQYRLGPVPAGSYYVVTTGRPWQEKQQMGGFEGRKESSQPIVAYPPTYYPGVTDGREAKVLALQVGREIRADIPLRAVPGATVKIRCPGSGMKEDACSGVPAFVPHGIGGVELPTPAEFDYESQSFVGVPPGRYSVRAVSPGKAAFKMIDVGQGEVTFNLNMQPPALISGTVTFQHPLPPRGTAYVRLDNETTGAGTGNAIGPDGSFAGRVGSGLVRPRLYGSASLFIAELTVDGVAVKDGLVDLTEKTTALLRILASDEVGRLRGFVMNVDRPVAAVLVVLAPSAGSNNPTHYYGFQTESDGSFDWVTIPAGDYLLFAADQLDLEYTNPAAVQPYLSTAIPVHIAPHAVVEQRVALTGAARK